MASFSERDHAFMQRALTLAEASTALASPNPRVGCVIAHGDDILGEGFHQYDLLDHAEIVALKQARSRGLDPSGATAYVTLEPCSHHGRTGPCAGALIDAGISRCVVATADPNPLVSGQGLARMSAAGIHVDVGLLQTAARALNQDFAFSITHARPFITLKAALSVDGFLAPQPALRTAAAPFWLTGPEARAHVQLLRHASDAILTGIGTVLADDPALTDRTALPRRRPLMRVALDPLLRIPRSARLLQAIDDDVWIFCSHDAPQPRVIDLVNAGAKVTSVDSSSSGLDLPAILSHLHQARLLSVLLEAGSTLNGAFLNQQLVDRVILYYAEAELGQASIPFARGFVSPFELEQRMHDLAKDGIGPDVRVSGLLHDPWASLTSASENPLS